MHIKFSSFFLIGGYIFFNVFIACKDFSKQVSTQIDTYNSGTIYISVDNSFRPIIEECIEVYQSQYPNTKIIPLYKTQNECQADIMNDSISLIICSNIEHDTYQKDFKKKYHFNYGYDLLAFDALCFMTNKKSKIEKLTKEDINKILLKKRPYSSIIVLADAPVASSNLQYLFDSFVAYEQCKKNIYPTKNPIDQINKITNNLNTFGIINALWLYNLKNKSKHFYYKNIKILPYKDKYSDTAYYPSPLSLSKGKYPFYKRMFYISKTNYSGLSSAFINFMTLEKGQLIFKRAKMVPAKMNLDAKLIFLKE